MTPDDWDRRYAEPRLVWSAEPNRFLVEQLADLAPGRALDLACGEGRNAIWLARQGWDVTGVDFSGVAIDKARRAAAEAGVTARFVRADLAEHVPEPGSADLVALMYLQVPGPLRTAVLGRAADALRPGGTLLWVAHDRSNLDGGHGGPRDPEVLSTPEDVAAALAGLDVLRAEVVRRPVTTDGGEAVALDTLVRAVRPG
ncbi:MAG TPA: class I SAM-dependent methyltransferase [Miltoncostaeaceae bacterium]|nr:class I SAM-dependent methyltransferase [Miltoncostaeaceae bacterium]